MVDTSEKYGKYVTLVCLANSRKYPGRCVAGKVIEKGRFGEWIRPVSRLEHGAIKAENQNPKLLDIISIPVEKPLAKEYQQENYRIRDKANWTNHGHISKSQLPNMVDEIDGPLWVNGYSGHFGCNDRIPEEAASGLDSSLKLIKPEGLMVSVGTESGSKRKVRAEFSLNGEHYKLSMTDPEQEMYFQMKNQELFDLSSLDIFMCVSIGEVHEGYCYKLAASIMKGDAE